jgi:hypothetical protein
MKNHFVVASLILAAWGLLPQRAGAWCGPCCQGADRYSFQFSCWPCPTSPPPCSGYPGGGDGCGLPCFTPPVLSVPFFNSPVPPGCSRGCLPPFVRSPEYGYDPGYVPPPPQPVSLTTPIPHDVLVATRAAARAAAQQARQAAHQARQARREACKSVDPEKRHERYACHCGVNCSACGQDGCSGCSACSSCNGCSSCDSGCGCATQPGACASPVAVPACKALPVSCGTKAGPCQPPLLKRFCHDLVYKPACWPTPQRALPHGAPCAAQPPLPHLP